MRVSASQRTSADGRGAIAPAALQLRCTAMPNVITAPFFSSIGRKKRRGQQPSNERRRSSGSGAQDPRKRTGRNGLIEQRLRRKQQRRQREADVTQSQRTVAKKAAVAALIQRRGRFRRAVRVMVTEPVRRAPAARVHRHGMAWQHLRNHGHADREPHGEQSQPCHPRLPPCFSQFRHPYPVCRSIEPI